MSSSLEFDNPWRRLPWTFSVAVVAWGVMLPGLAALMQKRPTSSQPMMDKSPIMSEMLQPPPPEPPKPQPRAAPPPPRAVPPPRQAPSAPKPETAPINAPAAPDVPAPPTAVATPGEGLIAVPRADTSRATPGKLQGPANLYAEEEAPPMEFWMVEEKPGQVNQVMPIYPEIARQAGMEGDVFVEMVVGTDGSVQEVKILRGPPVFQQAAIDAARKAKFTPAKQNDRPVRVKVSQRISFRLR